jgi:hypothetical protein
MIAGATNDNIMGGALQSSILCNIRDNLIPRKKHTGPNAGMRIKYTLLQFIYRVDQCDKQKQNRSAAAAK